MSLTLFINGQRVLNESITVAPSFDFTLGPGIARVGLITVFGVSTSRNISSITWTFGDTNTPQVTSGKTVNHRYTQLGTFNLTAEVTDSTGAVSRKTIHVQVGDAQQAANLTLVDYRKRIVSIDEQLLLYPEWVQDSIKRSLELESGAATIDSIARTYTSVENEAGYVDVINRLLALRIPRELVISTQGTLPLAASLEHIDTSLVEQVTSASVPDREAFISNLAYWTTQNYNAEIAYKTVSAVYDIELEPFFTLFTITPRELQEGEESYLVIGIDPAAIKAKEGYEERTLDGGTAYKITSGASYEFLILDALDPIQLGAFLIPLNVEPLLESSSGPLCTLDSYCDEAIGENADNCQDCRSYSGVYVGIGFILLALLAAGLGGLWWWYKTRYERELFPNRNDLSNVFIFIRNQKKAMVTDKDIREKLKKTGWTGEQISYVMKKIAREFKTPPSVAKK